MDKTATEAVMDKLLPFSIEQALSMGPFTLLTVCYRNANKPKHSFFFSVLVTKPQLQAVSDALDNLNLLTIADLIHQTVEVEALLVGCGDSVGAAQHRLSIKLMLLGRETQSESLRMQALMLTSDLLLTVTEKGVDTGEFMNPDDYTLASVIRVFQKAEEAAEKQAVIQTLAPAAGAETSYGAKLAAAINKTT